MKKTLFFLSIISIIILILFSNCQQSNNSSGSGGGSGDGSDGRYNDIYNLNLRETGPSGGIIFYINPNADTDGWRYLEAILMGQGTRVWISGGATQTTANGNTSETIGSGQANTTAIINQPGHVNSAAKICNDLVIGIYDDWFLPSRGELNKMYINLKSGTDENGVIYTPYGGFENDYYWSSSELNTSADFAWRQGFATGGNQISYYKSDSYQVRAIRAF